MAKIVALLPREYMKEQIEALAQEEELSNIDVHVIQTSEAVEVARMAVSSGAQVIIARGLQASIIKTNTNIPVVEVKLSAQEIGLLIVQGKKLLHKEHPQVALIGYENMFCDMSYFNQVFDIDFRTYFVKSFEDFEMCMDQAYADGADIVLGGDIVMDIAQKLDRPALFLASTEDSIKIALNAAKNVCYAIDIELSSNAQLETVMDTSFNGIVKIDNEGQILVINRMIEDLLGKSASEVVGSKIDAVFRDIDVEILKRILSGERENYSTTMTIGKQLLYVMMAPIQSEEEILGAIISCSKMKANVSTDSKIIREMYLNGYVAKRRFGEYASNEAKMKEQLQICKRYALSSYPVMIYGETGTEKQVLAECIHNNSARNSNPFGVARCAGMTSQMQYEYLFDKKTGLITLCNHGTVFIPEVEKLGEQSQFELYNCIRSRGIFFSNESEVRALNVRFIVGSCMNIEEMVIDGSFRKDLFYSLNGLNATIEPIRERKKDMRALLKRRVEEFASNHSVFLTVSEEAVKVILDYSWPGNWVQFDNFCERMLLTSSRKTIDAAFVQQLLEELYKENAVIDEKECVVVYRHPEAEKLKEILERNGGNRQKMAEELGISTTTLWRRLKKYHIE